MADFSKNVPILFRKNKNKKGKIQHSGLYMLFVQWSSTIHFQNTRTPKILVFLKSFVYFIMWTISLYEWANFSHAAANICARVLFWENLMTFSDERPTNYTLELLEI